MAKTIGRRGQIPDGRFGFSPRWQITDGPRWQGQDTPDPKYQNIKISKYQALGPRPKMRDLRCPKNDLFRNVQTDGLAKTIGRRGQNPYIRFGDFTPLAKYRLPQVSGSGHPRSQISKHQNMKISGLRPLPMVLARPRLLAFREMSFLDIPGRPFLARALSPDILIF